MIKRPFREVFTNPHTLIVVVHVTSMKQVVEQCSIAFEGCADGVFLINHDISPTQLLRAYFASKEEIPEKWMGLNMLGRTSLEALSLVGSMEDTIDAIWCDDGGIDLDAKDSRLGAREFFTKWSNQANPQMYFGGVAFKYRKPVSNPAVAAAFAVPYMSVVVTSGEATGSAPGVEKIRKMKAAIGDHPLAIASGITPENVHLFMPYCDCFMVATGISKSHDELDSEKLKRLVEVIRS